MGEMAVNAGLISVLLFSLFLMHRLWH